MSRFDTPCMDAPEMWVSDHAAARAIAAGECATCWRFDQCAEDATKRKPKMGVFAGVDYTSPNQHRLSVKALELSKRTCEHSGCGKRMVRNPGESLRNFGRRRYCSQSCANRGRSDAA